MCFGVPQDTVWVSGLKEAQQNLQGKLSRLDDSDFCQNFMSHPEELKKQYYEREAGGELKQKLSLFSALETETVATQGAWQTLRAMDRARRHSPGSSSRLPKGQKL